MSMAFSPSVPCTMGSSYSLPSMVSFAVPGSASPLAIFFSVMVPPMHV